MQHLRQLPHTPYMIIPHITNSLQKDLSLLTLMHGIVFAARRERRRDLLLCKLIQVLLYEIIYAIID